MITRIFLTLCAILAIAAPMTAQAYVAREGASLNISREVNDDLIVSGQSVTVDAPVSGELVAAGQDTQIKTRPSRSIWAAGNTVTISQGAGYNVFAAGNTVRINGTIEHDAFVAGQNIIIEEGARIRGTLYVAANSLTINGAVDGNVRFTGQALTSGATLGGDVRAQAETITFTGGSIGGTFAYAEGAAVTGQDRVTITGETETFVADVYTRDDRFADWLWAALTAFVTGAALLLLMPHKVRDSVQFVFESWGRAFLIGLGGLLLIPALIFLLIITFVGLPLAIVLALLAGIMVYFATIIAQIAVGTYLLRLFKFQPVNWLAALLVGVLVVSLLSLVPQIGVFLVLALFIGVTIPVFGAMLLWWRYLLSPLPVKKKGS